MLETRRLAGHGAPWCRRPPHSRASGCKPGRPKSPAYGPSVPTRTQRTAVTCRSVPAVHPVAQPWGTAVRRAVGSRDAAPSGGVGDRRERSGLVSASVARVQHVHHTARITMYLCAIAAGCRNIFLARSPSMPRS